MTQESTGDNRAVIKIFVSLLRAIAHSGRGRVHVLEPRVPALPVLSPGCVGSQLAVMFGRQRFALHSDGGPKPQRGYHCSMLVTCVPAGIFCHSRLQPLWRQSNNLRRHGEFFGIPVSCLQKCFILGFSPSVESFMFPGSVVQTPT